MRYWLSYFITTFFLTLGAFLLIWFFNPIAQMQASKQQIDSPLPSFLDMTQNSQVTGLTYWLPETPSDNSLPPEVTAKAALSYDLTTNTFLYSYNTKQKLPMASLTKIMTAIVALEHQKPDDKYLVHQEDLVGENTMGLEAREILSLEELLYGIFLRSANDATETIASNGSGGREQFITDMNNKTKALGLTDTNFTNPSGLEGDGDQYTTTYDLLVMTRYGLLNFPLFAKASSTIEISLPRTQTHKAYYLANETNLMTTYPGVKGLKTGYTPEAGLCLITYLEYGGHNIIAIVIGSESRRADMIKLLNHSLVQLGITPPEHD